MLIKAAASACFLGIIFSIAENVVPSEKFMPQIRVIFSLIFILVLVPPLTRTELFGDIPAIDAEDYSSFGEIAERLTNERITGNICDCLKNILEEKDIYPVKISVTVNNSADGSISITEAEILLKNSGDIQRTRRLVSEALGIPEKEVSVSAAAE